MKCSRLAHDLVIWTCLWLDHDLLMNCYALFVITSWLFYYLLMTCSWYFASSWLVHNLLMYCSFFFHNLFTKCLQFVHDFFMTSCFVHSDFIIKIPMLNQQWNWNLQHKQQISSYFLVHACLSLAQLSPSLFILITIWNICELWWKHTFLATKCIFLKLKFFFETCFLDGLLSKYLLLLEKIICW